MKQIRTSTKEQDVIDRGSAGFAVRTVIDDVLGKLHFIRGQIFIDVPEGVAGLVDDVDELVECVIGLVEDLPEAPPTADWDERPSASKCKGEGCSCGMQSWWWQP